MGQRAGHLDVLEPDGDGVGFGGADPYRQIALSVLLLENDHSLVIHQAHPYAVDEHLHYSHSFPPPGSSLAPSTAPFYPRGGSLSTKEEEGPPALPQKKLTPAARAMNPATTTPTRPTPMRS